MLHRKTQKSDELENKEAAVSPGSEKIPLPTALEKAPSCPQSLQYEDGELPATKIKRLVGDRYTVGKPSTSAIGVKHSIKSNQNDSAEPPLYEGWKVHISIDKCNISKASELALQTIGTSKYEPDEFKIATSNKIGEAEGKIITIYFIDENNIDHQALNRLLQDIENHLREQNISAGPLVHLDKSITGSKYMFYRCAYQLMVSWTDSSGKTHIVPKEKIVQVKDGTFERKDLDPTDAVKIAAHRKTELHNPFGYKDSFGLGNITIGQKLSSSSTVSRVLRKFTPSKPESDKKIFDKIEKLLKQAGTFSHQKEKTFRTLWESLGEKGSIYTLEYLISNFEKGQIKDFLDNFKYDFCAAELGKWANKEEPERIQCVGELPKIERDILKKMLAILGEGIRNKKEKIKANVVRAAEDYENSQLDIDVTRYFLIIQKIGSSFEEPPTVQFVKGEKIQKASTLDHKEEDAASPNDYNFLNVLLSALNQNDITTNSGEKYTPEILEGLIKSLMDIAVLKEQGTNDVLIQQITNLLNIEINIIDSNSNQPRSFIPDTVQPLEEPQEQREAKSDIVSNGRIYLFYDEKGTYSVMHPAQSPSFSSSSSNSSSSSSNSSAFAEQAQGDRDNPVTMSRPRTPSNRGLFSRRDSDSDIKVKKDLENLPIRRKSMP